MKEYYVYIYLDPRKPGKFYFPGFNLSFLFAPIYIGKGKNFRMEEHLYKTARKRKSFFSNVLRKIINEGLTPIRFKLLENLTQEEAFENEINFIKTIGRRDLGNGTLLNFSDGGMGGKGGNVKRVLSEEGRRKLCEARRLNPTRKGKKNSLEHIKKCIEKRILNNSYKHTDETKEKMSNLKLGKKLNKEHIESLKKAQKERFLKGKNKTAFGKDKVKCPYCPVEMNLGLIKRYHFDNCKYKL